MSIKKIAILMAMAVTVNTVAGVSPMASAQEVQASRDEVGTDNAVSITDGEDTETVTDTEDADNNKEAEDKDATDKTDTKVTEQPNTTKKTVKKTVKKTTKKVKKATKKKVKKDSYTKAELKLMSSIILCEAGGESYQGQLAVGIVVMNRVKSKSFPNTVKGVIYQKRQFSPVHQGKLKKRLSQYSAGRTKSGEWKSCIKAAKKVLEGQRTVIYKGKVKNMSSYHFFSVKLPGARFKLGGHRFK